MHQNYKQASHHDYGGERVAYPLLPTTVTEYYGTRYWFLVQLQLSNAPTHGHIMYYDSTRLYLVLFYTYYDMPP